jgi:ABC-type transport system substrate-binding protein
VFLGQIYEPPLQYHFLKRPYQLIPLTATEIPEAIYQDAKGNIIDENEPSGKISRVIYRITIHSGVLYQPHPALATGKTDDYIYHDLEEGDLKGIHTLADFKEKGTRALTAADYIYQIKRMAHPKIHSPIAGLMSQYILGLSELSKQLAEEYKNVQTNEASYIDLRKYDFEGARIIDETTFEIILKEKYPQFLYWLSMSFFSPMPWEADVFYSQEGMRDRNISLDWYPIGTGPFMLSENNPNRRMVLDRNPNFRGETFPETGEENDAALGLLEDAGKAMPFVDKAIFSLEKESIPNWNKLLQGYYDTSCISSDLFDQEVQFNT